MPLFSPRFTGKIDKKNRAFKVGNPVHPQRLAMESLESRLVLSASVNGDFNNDGFDDLAVGVIDESVGIAKIPGGAVNVIYGSATGLDAAGGPGNQLWHQDRPGILDSAEAGDEFGATLAIGDFNNDTFDDLAIGAPGDTVGIAKILGGIVNVIYGSATGLDAAAGPGNQLWHQDRPGVLESAEVDDLFGDSLTVGDFNGDNIDDLAVGVPNETVGIAKVERGGAVNVIYGSATGLTSTGNQLWHQDRPGILENAQPLDSFGFDVVAGDFNGDEVDDLAVGVPREDVGIAKVSKGGGAVNLIYGTLGTGLTSAGNQLWHQDRPGILESANVDDVFGSALAAGDFNADSFDDLAVGVPLEDVGIAAVTDAGAVNVIYGSQAGLASAAGPGNQLWHQDRPGIIEKAENNPIGPGEFESDSFGASLTAGDFDGNNSDDLAIGVPGESVGIAGIVGGAVNLIYGSTVTGLTATANQIWHQDRPSVVESTNPADFFGATLAFGDFNNDQRHDLVIGVPGEDVGIAAVLDAGAVNVIYGSAAGLAALAGPGNQLWHQDRPGIQETAEVFDLFGEGLSESTSLVDEEP